MNMYNELEKILEQEMYDIAENVFATNDLTRGDLKEENDLKELIEDQIKEFLIDNYEGDELNDYEETFDENKEVFFNKHLKTFKAIIRDLIRSEG